LQFVGSRFVVCSRFVWFARCGFCWTSVAPVRFFFFFLWFVRLVGWFVGWLVGLLVLAVGCSGWFGLLVRFLVGFRLVVRFVPSPFWFKRWLFVLVCGSYNYVAFVRVVRTVIVAGLVGRLAPGRL